MAMAKMKRVAEDTYRFFCPGCQEFHVFTCNGKLWPSTGATWNFDGNLENPTVTPSINIGWGKQADPNWVEPEGEDAAINWSGRCHSTITEGKISFAKDSTHILSGQRDIELPDIQTV